MLFQVLDDKPQKFVIYANNRLYKNEIPESISKTYKYPQIFRLRNDDNIEYLENWAEGKTLDELCPESLKEDWNRVNGRIKAFYRSAEEVNLDISKYMLTELVPERILLEFGELSNKICDHSFKCLTRPEHLDIINLTSKFITDIRNQQLKLNFNKDICNQDKYKDIVESLKKKDNTIEYNQFSTLTRRLTVKNNSFPVLNLHKPLREVVEPKNDYFIELDMNGFDLRTFLGLMNEEQPLEDIHDWNIKNVLKGTPDRPEAKRKFFSWFYNPEVQDPDLERVYNRSQLSKKYFFGDHIKTPYGDICEATNFNWLSHLIQRTNSNIFSQQVSKLWKMLLDKDTRIVVLMHDSVLLDVSSQDHLDINQLKQEFGDTRFGDFRVTVKKGLNWGQMNNV